MHTIVVGRGKGPERLLEGESARVTAVESAYAMYLGKHHHQAVESPTYEERERDSGKREMRGRWGEREDEGLPHWIWIYCESVKGEVIES
jgi:hypothetical protein